MLPHLQCDFTLNKPLACFPVSGLYGNECLVSMVTFLQGFENPLSHLDDTVATNNVSAEFVSHDLEKVG